ncbi:hypothetical protein BCV72DRAFT_304208 [Rhizopus microsporus var. microsporus]|uniref:Arrestin C-terminal-like domain-containing protein n=2 Tax=Rhizopus microsporus TaxID=58291 RepID=A0A2G4SY11_RHIZD|nr:uncharacterized protein RHIMIDRAFT_122784 [Rhizopus microsporus ATCC 52813]ORE07957.1 hypothetical protein BCV72DRAFT_304208 [Rhizopus microsporus var. microsporus]PHZ13634.1 hypothetical protein RHIMIDRAFT_122784 [Rhizopus microsporus ATCC 52813]
MVGKSSELKIELSSTDVILFGHASESSGKALQGSVILSLSEPMKVRSITLNFVGKMKVAWSEGVGHHQHYHKQEREIIEQKWQFVPILDQSHKKVFTLGPGQHKWDFELTLPGDLPQSLESEGGQVVYRFKATVERTAFVHNIVKKQPIQIIRCMLPSEYELTQTLEIHNTWAEKMMYDIVLPSKVYARGQSIPITFHITPIAERLRVRSLTGSLKEYCTYTTSECSKTDTRIVKSRKQDFPFGDTDERSEQQEPIYWTRTLSLDIPPMSSHMAFCDADNDMIRIRHKLKFVICLINADGHLSELRCSVPVIIISSIAQQTELGNTLPAYDQTWQTVLCVDPLQQPSQDENIEWWQGQDLSRVPSYRTAAQQDPVPLSSSLPTYEQLNVGSPRRATMFGQLSMSPAQP